MDLYNRPIAERIEWLFELARRHSAEFVSPELQLARKMHVRTVALDRRLRTLDSLPA